MAATSMPMKSLIENLMLPNHAGIVASVITSQRNDALFGTASQHENPGTVSLVYDQSDLSETAENTVHIEIAEYPNNILDSKPMSLMRNTNTSNDSEKSPVILFKWEGMSNKPLRCQICDMAFSDGTLLREHLNRHDVNRKVSQKPFPCTVNRCCKSFKTERSLERHQLTHVGQSVKRCKYCYKVFANKENLDKHLVIHNGQRLHCCTVCNKGFISKDSLDSHTAIHNKEKNFKCKVCGKAFDREDSLQRHIVRHSSAPEKKHKCVECYKSFSYLFALKKHVRSVHGGEPDGKHCEICGKFIKNRENVSRHMMIHVNKRPFKCGFCSQSFVQKQHLLDHMDVHSSKSSYSCKICGNNFRHRRSLNRHLHKHYSVPVKGVYACSKCDEQFNSETEIADHILNSHVKELFCSLCKTKCSDENELADHMLNEHCTIVKSAPELVHKATDTYDKTGEEIQNYEHPYAEVTDSIKHEAAAELLNIRKYHQQSYDDADHVKTEETYDQVSNIDDTAVVNEDVSIETSENVDNENSNIVDIDHTSKVIQARVDKDGNIYIVYNDLQDVSDITSQNKERRHVIIKSSNSDTQDTDRETEHKMVSSDHSHMYFDNSIESDSLTGSQVIHIPESVTQSGSQVIYSSESFDLTGSHIIHIPEVMDTTGSNIVLIPESLNQTGPENSVNVSQTGIHVVDIPDTVNPSGSPIYQIHGTISQNQSGNGEVTQFVENLNQSDSEVIQVGSNTNESSVTLKVLKEGTENDENGAEHETSSSVESEIPRSLNNDQCDRSALLQSLIDYAEKIQDKYN